MTSRTKAMVLLVPSWLLLNVHWISSAGEQYAVSAGWFYWWILGFLNWIVFILLLGGKLAQKRNASPLLCIEKTLLIALAALALVSVRIWSHEPLIPIIAVSIGALITSAYMLRVAYKVYKKEPFCDVSRERTAE